MAERLAPGDYDQLHHFVAARVWKEAPLQTKLLIQADKLVGGSDAVLVIDDTSMPNKGKHSVGFAALYTSTLGNTANCQTLVSLTLARGEVPVTVALRLFLPESWTSDRARLKRAGVPAEHRTARTKPEIALAEIDHMIAAGVRFGCVLADAGYGLSAPFRQGLTARSLAWAVRIPRHLKVYPVGVRLIWPHCRARPSSWRVLINAQLGELAPYWTETPCASTARGDAPIYDHAFPVWRDSDGDYSEALSEPDGGSHFRPADIGALGDPCHR